MKHKNVVEVKIKYIGYFQQIVNKREECIRVPAHFKQGLVAINRHLKEKCNIRVPFTLLLNERHIVMLLKEGEFTFQEEDVVKVIPVISGG